MCVRPPMKFPSLLPPGSRVGLVAPAGPLRDETDLERAVASVRSCDWEPVVGAHVLEREGYFAGTDAHRLADLNRFAADSAVDGIWCIRGGYGTMRLLDGLDFEAWQRSPKALIGYSDITALHAAIGQRAALITFHGPTARGELTPFSRASLRSAVIDGTDSAGTASDALTLQPGRAEGRLVGGNLALVSSLIGTRYEPSFDGAILVLEDVSESVYRLDRMLTQLRLSGSLDQLAGIALGQFSDIPVEPANDTRPLLDLLYEVADQCAVPCLADLPIGHTADQWTIPLGATAELDADNKTLMVIR
jgi:muramoyltetrapeptide carboxypeptidase